MSPFQRKFPEKNRKKSRKLAPNLLPKTKYVTHYRNLKFYVQLGCRITKIHRVLAFRQEAWLARYIDFNTKMRAQQTSTFGKDFFKLMNNAVFGKLQENLRKRIKVEIVTDEELAKKRVCKPNMKRSLTIHSDLVIIETFVESLELNRPVYSGMVVLDLSKLWMYKFHYLKMRRWFKDIQLCFSDTDSLLYRIGGDQNVYETMKAHEEDFDFSDYPRDHFCYSSKNKKVIGCFKDELHSLPLEEFIGLRPKSYSLKFRGKVKDGMIVDMKEYEKQVAKGTKKKVKDRFLRHEHYREVLDELKSVYVRQNVILSRQHDVGTYHQTKVSLTAFDTKRWICDDGYHTLAHGHCLAVG